MRERRPRFAFVVHALSDVHRRVLGLRQFRPGLLLGYRDGTSIYDLGEVARMGIDGVVDGVILTVPMTPEQMVADQRGALARMERVVRTHAEPIDAVGLGSLCAVVAGRGEFLAERLTVPVTTGGAATAWSLAENARELLRARPGRVAVIGAASPVGKAVAALLAEGGAEVVVDNRRSGKALSLEYAETPEAAVAGCSLVIGAGPTGGTLDAAALESEARLIDVAIPGTLRGGRHRDVEVFAGEAVGVPRGWYRGRWGRLYQIFAGYGPFQVYACLIEPLVMAVAGRVQPYALGRRLAPEDVVAFGHAAEGLGFQPRLARGWRRAQP